MRRVYISASTQKENIGINNYGNEQDRMMTLSDRVKYWLETQKEQFTVFRNQPNWSLEQTVNDCNSLACEIFIDNHTNAGPRAAAGTELYYHVNSINGRKLASALYASIAPLSPGRDRGIMNDTVLYANGLYVLRETAPPAALIEHIYHTNASEVSHFLANSDLYAKAEAQAICSYFGIKWVEPKTDIERLVDGMLTKKWITDKPYWLEVLEGKRPADPKFLKLVFARALDAK